jgi:hypothetical protein
MGKKRHHQNPDEDDSDEASKSSGSADDPLGKLLQQYQVSLAGVLLISGVIALTGIGVLAYALTRQPYSLTFLLVGAAALVLAVAWLGMNAFNIGRRLELRKRGVRFTELGVVTELFWDEIARVEVNRTDDTNLGVATVRRRSRDASSPSGLLTNTEWHVTLHGHDGRTIHLRPMFLRTVPDPKKLISQLRLRAGLP